MRLGPKPEVEEALGVRVAVFALKDLVLAHRDFVLRIPDAEVETARNRLGHLPERKRVFVAGARRGQESGIAARDLKL